VPTSLYSTRDWRLVSDRARERDGLRCTVARLLGGPCSERLHAHHLIPASERPDLALDLDNVVTACASHHPRLEALRRSVVERREPRRRCPHRHRTRYARQLCESRLNRDRQAA
jgi:hypothetical protein